MNVKVFAAILYAAPEALEESINKLSVLWGRPDYRGAETLFNVTDYYHKEMGAPLHRLIVSFEKLTSPSLLPEQKQQAVSMEQSLRNETGGRRVNIDSGYLDFDKVVLASTKPGPYKIYMKDGIWADMTLHYEKGRFHPFPWTFSDFKDGRYDGFFLRIREILKKQS